jgi:hypothetical protein
MTARPWILYCNTQGITPVEILANLRVAFANGKQIAMLLLRAMQAF